MSSNSPLPNGLFFKLYVAAGILIFISIGYTYMTGSRTNDHALSAAAEKITPSVLTPVQEKWLKDSTEATNVMNQAMNLYSNKQYRECIEQNRRAIALNPGLSRAYNNICSCYNCLNQWDSAIAACNRAIELNPDFALAKNNRDYSYSMKNKPGN